MKDSGEYTPPIVRADEAVANFLQKPKGERLPRLRINDETLAISLAATATTCCIMAGYVPIEVSPMLHPNDPEKKSV